MSLAGRPTLYKGVWMRSRLEADFAQRVLDHGIRPGEFWKYEPCCFASERGQYLPDFGFITANSRTIYWEVKPFALWQQGPTDSIFELVSKMTIVWDSEPAAALMLVFWSYGGGLDRSCCLFASRQGTLWEIARPGQRDFVVWELMETAH